VVFFISCSGEGNTFTGDLLSFNILYKKIFFLKLSRKKRGAKFFFREGDSPDYLLRPLNPSLVSKRECIAKITRR